MAGHAPHRSVLVQSDPVYVYMCTWSLQYHVCWLVCTGWIRSCDPTVGHKHSKLCSADQTRYLVSIIIRVVVASMHIVLNLHP